MKVQRETQGGNVITDLVSLFALSFVFCLMKGCVSAQKFASINICCMSKSKPSQYEKILHVFSIKIVVPYEAATQKVKNRA